ncbi:PREDICTED: uncharacterized protein LOC109584408 [Amphimedon queenslandica]|uniref:Uncharacterized protein n=1 Tax=Amphimedon queenslandica TaxID=400682 RepID=A0AAN0JFY1_AMPQE|nr:PREDICTED: uncharacterized protein LOC109584408 [Amphimedon queenslandica]|eukprot:XP_019855711.1 PREDICTED: uncharacterized protein LOC109584408 [Amphimedon queenslandica]
MSQREEENEASTEIELHSLEADNPIYDRLSTLSEPAPDSPLYDDVEITIERQCPPLPEAEEYIEMSAPDPSLYENVEITIERQCPTLPEADTPHQVCRRTTMVDMKLYNDQDSTGCTERKRVKCYCVFMISCIAVISLMIIPVLVFSFAISVPNMEAIKAKLEEIDGESAKTRKAINELNATITQIINQSSFVVSDINSTLAGQEEIEADLRNVDVYSSCIQEYLSSCSMPIDIFRCTTDYHDVIVDGYYNLDLACHIEVLGNETVFFSPLTNLRMMARSGETIQSSDSASVKLAKSKVRCECAMVPLSTGATRNEEIHCQLYRSRCPFTSTFKSVLIKP